MNWQTIGEIVLAILTSVLGVGGVSVHSKHKRASEELKTTNESLGERVKALETAKEFWEKDFKKIVKDIEYIRRKIEKG